MENNWDNHDTAGLAKHCKTYGACGHEDIDNYNSSALTADAKDSDEFLSFGSD